MFTRVVVCFLIAMLSAAASAQLVSRTLFTYQGRLESNGALYTGQADFIVTLHATSTGNSIVSGPLALNNQPVQDGVFTLQLDFGVLEPRVRRFIEVQVRAPAGSGSFVALTRQPIDLVPRAASAIRAESAEPFNLAFNPNPVTLDQQQLDASLGVSSTSVWQSFRASQTGELTHIAAYRLGNLTFTNATLRLYAGTGVGSTPIYTQTISLPPVVGEMLVSLVRPVPLTQGSTYTFELSFGANSASLGSSLGNAYPDGEASVAGRDLYFKTFFGAPTGDVSLRSRFFGVNTPVPAAPLHVSGGNVLPHAQIAATSEAPAGTALSLDATATPGGNNWLLLSTGGTATEGQGRFAFRSLTTGAYGPVITSNGNLGLNTFSPEQRLTVNGTAQVLTGTGSPNYLAFGAVSPSENTDLVAFFRVNQSTAGGNASELRLNLGDDPNTGLNNLDSFSVGSTSAGVWIPAVSFRSDGAAFKPGGGTWANLSDPRAKHDVTPLQGTLDRLLSLRGYRYFYNDDAIRSGQALPGLQIGLMADEVERVFPDWITRDANGTRFVTERSTTALMVEALRDLRTEKDAELRTLRQLLDEERQKVRDLENRLKRLEALVD